MKRAIALCCAALLVGSTAIDARQPPAPDASGHHADQTGLSVRVDPAAAAMVRAWRAAHGLDVSDKSVVNDAKRVRAHWQQQCEQDGGTDSRTADDKHQVCS